MAIARDATSSGSTSGTSLTVSHTVSGSNRILLVGVTETSVGFTSSQITGITYNGVAMSKLVDYYRTFASGFLSSIWFLAAPDTGTHDIVLSGASDDYSLYGVSYTGAAQTAPTGNAIKQFSSNANNTCSFSPVSITDDSWAFSTAVPLDAAIVNGTNYTALFGGNNTCADSNGNLGTAGTESVTCTQASSGQRWGGCCTVVFAPAAAASGPANLSTWNGVAKASVATLNGQTMANTASWNGVA